MSLPKKDVRAAISVEAHDALTAIAELKDNDVGEQAALILEEALLGKVHAARLLAERAARFGKTRTVPEKPGGTRKETAGR